MATAQLVLGAPGQVAQRVATEGGKVEAGVWRVLEEPRQGDLVHRSGSPGDVTRILVPQMVSDILSEIDNFSMIFFTQLAR